MKTSSSQVTSKVNSRLFFLSQLKLTPVIRSELVLFYSTCIRPVMEYACAVYTSNLLQCLSLQLERCQNRAMRILFPDIWAHKTYTNFAFKRFGKEFPSIFTKRPFEVGPRIINQRIFVVSATPKFY